MEIIRLQHPYHKEQIPKQKIVLALGFFDGVHRGHQAVIRRAKEEAQKRGVPLAVMTFNQHPKILYRNLQAEDVQYLTLLERKLELLRALAVDYLFLVDYTLDFGKQSPQSFVDDYIVGLNAIAVVAGFDYTYGKKALANMETLPVHAKERFDVIEVPELIVDEQKVGSSNIKTLIESNHIENANRELGYAYQTSGVVVHGDKRGRTIGYPTANVQINPQEVLPSVGVYVVRIFVDGTWYQGMASIGYNITFEANRRKTCEVYILDFDRDIYGYHVRVEWLSYLRNEMKFSGIDGLVAQLDADLLQTREYFERNGYGEQNGVG
ncbi:riboflavin biosynthesis protein RibF [Tuanshanicoccus lijuaniae]|uniref:riboflavin biosynthesis protein RibF n=1 Tax=Aerococcaceae bacterium zg-1292 TaxID=2774330 RepID=UPI001BD7FB5A|nr:riboflavin biosynthesis protein RibF [Aerococcaceae bacterium zg-BR22]MBS4456532.1 riboflavin biosynthesis protein RibF [Aerococcaceae bacterium zg-A91]MBS4458696.1 riboflavin biosynthesis protein RibF [Aerococcaceae bacterium zg-BR33]